MVTRQQKKTIKKVNLDPFFNSILMLKTVKRAGWVSKVKVKEPESVADHTFSMCAVGMVLSDIIGLDTRKVMKMIILHDLAESIVGDYMPEEMGKRRKISLEKKAMSSILSCVPAATRKEYESIWLEYIANKTEVARFVHRIDKFEMALQAGVYAKAGYGQLSLHPFFKSALKAVNTGSKDLLVEMLNAIKPMPSK